MKINSMSNNSFGATLSGNFLKIMTESLVNKANDADVKKAFQAINHLIPEHTTDIWVSKPTKIINFHTKKPQLEAIIIVTKNHISKGIKFKPDDKNPNLIEQYLFQIKRLAKQDFSKQYNVDNDGIEWIV